jgi:cephalosporin hydroxylase
MGSHKLRVASTEVAARCHTLLVTRYFLRGFAPQDRTELDAGQLKAWFSRRAPLFTGYTLPSVLGQRFKSFTWIILVDDACVDLLPTQLLPHVADGRIRLLTVNEAGGPISSLGDLNDVVTTAIAQQFQRMHADGVSDPIVTVARLDNDDAIAKDYFELLNYLAVVAARGGERRDTIVTFPHGLQYKHNGEFATYMSSNNHFLASLHFEHRSSTDRLHAHSFNHSLLFAKQLNTLVANTDLPMWVEIVHGENVFNRYRPVSPIRGNSGFEERFCSAYPVSEAALAHSTQAEGEAAEARKSAEAKLHALELTLGRELTRVKDRNKLLKERLLARQASYAAVKASTSFKLGRLLVGALTSPAAFFRLPVDLPRLAGDALQRRRERLAVVQEHDPAPPAELTGPAEGAKPVPPAFPVTKTHSMIETTLAPTPKVLRETAPTAAVESLGARARLAEAIRASIVASGAMKPPVFASVYESVLSRIAVNRLFEIGIHLGGSIRMWRQLLGADARIACMDIKPEACDTVRGVADHVYAGSQTDADLLSRIAAEAGPFDLIIDDGSHRNPHMIFSFEALFEHVRPGGAYVIEDMFTSYWPRYRGGLRKPGTLVEYVKDVLDRLYVPYVSQKYKAHFLDEAIPQLQHCKVSADIASIEFFAAGIVVVHKRADAAVVRVAPEPLPASAVPVNVSAASTVGPGIAATSLPSAPLKLQSHDCLLTSLNREAVLKLIPKGGVGVEIGVNRGMYARRILENAAPRRLHLVDPWPTDSGDDYIRTYGVRDDMETHYQLVKTTFADAIACGQVVLHRQYSRESASSFAHGELDFAYVDGMHTYEACLEDLRLFAPKVKPGGLLMGHDFSNTVMGRRKAFGVVRAVSEFVAESDFRPVLVTLESAPSYVLTRDAVVRDRLITAALEASAGVLVPLARLVQMAQIAVPLGKRAAQVIRIA